MAINFPTGLDSLTRYVDGTTVIVSSTQNNMQLAIEALQVKVGIDSSAVAASHDFKIAALEGGVLTASGATPFNTTMAAASTFEDLDLSGTVGTNVALVHLEVKLGAANAAVYVAITKGYGGAFAEHFRTGDQAGGCSVVGEAAANAYGQMTLMTDATGKIQHGFTNNTTTIQVRIIGWLI